MKTVLLLALFCSAVSAQVLQIGVFTLFRPIELRITPANDALLVESRDGRVVLEGRQSITIRLTQMVSPVRVSARGGADAGFLLSIPGKIERRFHGVLTIRPGEHQLIAVVAMDREAAVASVVAAEMPPGTPLEALKAQAVVTRSYYAAGRVRHGDFDFCDTTHCQFLRARPEAWSAAGRASATTRSLLLAYADQPFPALFSAACGGRTRSLPDEAGYPYHSVPCDFCSRHPQAPVQGHQLGLCQRGAAGMAASGADFRTILDHYYPGTSVIASAHNPTIAP